jgi:deoxyribodipyrimidine photo-lyase
MSRLNHYFLKLNNLFIKKPETEQKLFSKFSATLGCISPRRIYKEIKNYEMQFMANDSTYLLVLNCMARFLSIYVKKYQTKFCM